MRQRHEAKVRVPLWLVLLISLAYWLAFVGMLIAAPCDIPRDRAGKILRDKAAIAAFVRANPCPATGRHGLPCEGYVIDHIVPLCACGRDAPDNLRWQRKAAALAKDRAEVALCRWIEEESGDRPP